jgi:hypothetical protein
MNHFLEKKSRLRESETGIQPSEMVTEPMVRRQVSRPNPLFLTAQENVFFKSYTSADPILHIKARKYLPQ